ncbi:MAG: HAMP domain-containing protein [Telmatospirillum sp.]|nr:HAMP domain-containing protein [Telmatospirillum sp.]
MKLLPDSIRTRTILVLLIGLTMSHLASTVVYSTGHDDPPAPVDGPAAVDRLATLAGLIDRTAADSRARVAQALSRPGLHLSWTEAVAPDKEDAVADAVAGRADKARWIRLRDALAPSFGPLDEGRLSLRTVRPAPPAGTDGALHLLHGIPPETHLAGSIGLADGSRIAFHMAGPVQTPTWTQRSLISTLVMLAGTLVIAVWATGWITAPLAAFARAAERLGTDVAAAPLAEDGPREVRAAARAFNQMQRRIRSFVDDRLQFVAAVSHDLRTPITRLRLRTEQLPIDPGQQDKMLRDLDEMEQMVASSMAFARDEAADEPAQAFDLAALLGTLCDDLADAGQDVSFAWSGRLVYRGRPLAMKRLFANLLENAVRYGRRAEVSAGRSPSGLVVRIVDAGPGIPEDQLERVFRPFYRIEGSRNRRTGGLGLGLATVRGVARGHGGDVTLTNRPEGGLCATVTLPVAGDDGKGRAS